MCVVALSDHTAARRRALQDALRDPGELVNVLHLRDVMLTSLMSQSGGRLLRASATSQTT